MIVDTSALVAILKVEPDAAELPLLFKGNDFAHTDVKPAVSADQP
jgi:uncharacterized protein with PIN domain